MEQQIIMGRVNEEYSMGNGLLGSRGFIKLNVMDNDFATASNVVKSRYRMLHHFEEYELVDIELESESGEKLSVFCMKNMVNEVKQSVESRDSVFVWNVEFDYIIMHSYVKENFCKEVNDDYANWWLSFPLDEREERFWNSCK